MQSSRRSTLEKPNRASIAGAKHVFVAMENTENAAVHGVFRTLDSATPAREKDFGSGRLHVDDADQWTLAEYNGEYPVATITRFELKD